LGAERLRESQRRTRDAAPDTPDEHPFARSNLRLRHEHAIGGLENERKCRRLFERHVLGDRVELRPRHGDQLGVRAVHVLADDGDLAVPVVDAGIDDYAFAASGDHARAVGTKNARLRHGRESFADPDVEVIERGLLADMRFTMAHPERSGRPDELLSGARTVVSAAHCYWTEEPALGEGEGRLARYTWYDGYAVLREQLDELGRRLGGSYRVLVDANHHVDREGAARSGVGFYGKNTMLITRRH